MGEGLSVQNSNDSTSEAVKPVSETKTKRKAKEAPKIGLLAVEAKPERETPKLFEKPKSERSWHDAPRIEAKPAALTEKRAETAALPEKPAEVSPDEALIVEQATAEVMQKSLPEQDDDEEDEETDTAQALPDKASHRMLSKITEEGKGSEAAFVETLQELGVKNEKITALREATAVVPESGGEADGEDADSAAEEDIDWDADGEPETDESAETEETEPGEPATESEPEAAPEVPAAEEDEEAAVPADPTAGGSGPGGPTAPSGGGGGGGGAGGPGGPHGGGPVPPFGSGGPGGLPHANFAGGFNPNLNTPLATVPAAAIERSPDYHGGNAAGAALLGGIIGYLIGRRRGRIKTEKKLLPVQKKLEKQVGDLQWQLQERERTIRRVAAEQVRTRGVRVAERFNQVTEQQAANRTEHVPASSQERRAAPEARQLHSSQQAPEHIGQMLMAAEAAALARARQAAPERAAGRAAMEKSPEATPKPLTEKRIETLNRAELLELSERIVIEGSTLRQIYENNLVGERGLRRIITEYMHGGDIKKALKHEILEREIDFERDPVMRDLAKHGGSATGASTSALNTLIEKAAASVDGGPAELAAFQDRAKHDLAQEQQEKQRQIIDISMGAVILSLFAAVIYLFLTRG